MSKDPSNSLYIAQALSAVYQLDFIRQGMLDDDILDFWPLICTGELLREQGVEVEHFWFKIASSPVDAYKPVSGGSFKAFFVLKSQDSYFAPNPYGEDPHFGLPGLSFYETQEDLIQAKMKEQSIARPEISKWFPDEPALNSTPFIHEGLMEEIAVFLLPFLAEQAKDHLNRSTPKVSLKSSGPRL